MSELIMKSTAHPGTYLLCNGQEVVATVHRNAELVREIISIKTAVASLFDAIAHGDEEHRTWLKTEIERHFAKAPDHGDTNG